MKKKITKIIIAILICAVIGVALAIIIPKLKKDEQNPIQLIGIGGGGAFFNAKIDPTNPDIYYVTSDMGGLYYSYNKGQTWERTVKRAVFNKTHIADNGTVFAGGCGVYASYDNGKTLTMIYPKDVKHSVSRCGWNENLMLAEGYDNGYLNSFATYGQTLYFATIDWEGNMRVMQSDFYGDNLKIIYTQKFNDIYDPMSVGMYMVVKNNNIYFTVGSYITCVNLETLKHSTVYTAKGIIRDLTIIQDYFYIIDDTQEKSQILYTKDFVTYNDLMDFNTLTTAFTKYGRDGTFNWHFKNISGINLNNIYLSFSAPVNEFTDTVDGILKFNGNSFEWVFDSMFKTRFNTTLNGWSYGCHGPFYSIFANPHDENMCLVSNIETVYSMYYKSAEERQIKTLHGNEHENSTYSTNGLDVQTTYSVHHDPFDNNHIIICTTDLGLQNSFDGGKTWARMTITGTNYDIYNTCYDLYFDEQTKDLVYGLWSSRHDAPYNPTYNDKDYTQGRFGISYDGGKTWDFEYSSGLPQDCIPVKFSIEKTNDNLTIAVATFNRGFYISYDSGKTFEYISQNMEQTNGLIFGEDIVLDGDIVYCLTAPIIDNGNWLPSKLYEYNHKTKTLKNINLGEIVLARSLTYNKQYGLYINVMPTYHYEWFEEYNNGMFVNDNGGIYFYNGEKVTLVATNTNGIFSSKFSADGKLYAVDQYGQILVLENNQFKIYLEDLFTMLKHISFSPDGKIMYITAFGGGVYRVDMEKINNKK